MKKKLIAAFLAASIIISGINMIPTLNENFFGKETSSGDANVDKDFFDEFSSPSRTDFSPFAPYVDEDNDGFGFNEDAVDYCGGASCIIYYTGNPRIRCNGYPIGEYGQCDDQCENFKELRSRKWYDGPHSDKWLYVHWYRPILLDTGAFSDKVLEKNLFPYYKMSKSEWEELKKWKVLPEDYKWNQKKKKSNYTNKIPKRSIKVNKDEITIRRGEKATIQVIGTTGIFMQEFDVYSVDNRYAKVITRFNKTKNDDGSITSELDERETWHPKYEIKGCNVGTVKIKIVPREYRKFVKYVTVHVVE